MYVRINFFFIKIERSRSWFTDSGLNWSWCTADINDTTKYFQPIIIFKWKSYFNCLLFYKDGTLIYLSMTLGYFAIGSRNYHFTLENIWFAHVYSLKHYDFNQCQNRRKKNLQNGNIVCVLLSCSCIEI